MNTLPAIPDRKKFLRAINQKTPKYLKPEAIRQIIYGAKKDRYSLLFLLLWQTGCRISEALALTPQDIDWNFKQIRITTLKRRGKADRHIPLKEELLGALGVYINTYKLTATDRLFSMTPQAVHQELKGILAAQNMPNWIHIHTFRHSFAVNCLAQGMNISTLKEVLGHACVENTMVYLKVFQPEVQDQFNKIVF